ncbi:DUF4136 domain-containing protein [Thiocapsa roseopersicina]|uniref:DUF4136 domain-containing protein n=1 Tax=Thiocapsa roseopersicina TaxID=1058 RepID=A0A1H2SJ84_THIRO|nr:DUF4136 domain-containing protein [Thiocapsa roseopersicina]SDW31650.1 protein of unknown function [Thiocapsa roseopersicina]
MRFLVYILAGLLVGCSMVQSRVTSFHTLPQSVNGVTFAIVPFDWQKGSAEFQTYQNRIASELVARGFIASSIEEAIYAVFLQYAIDDGREVAYSYPIFGQTGISSAQTHGTLSTYGSLATYSGTTTYTPTYGVVGMGSGSRTEFTRVVRLEILDNRELAAGRVQKVFEGEVRSAGSTGQLSAVMPTLLDALFNDFPGESGKSRDIELPMR